MWASHDVTVDCVSATWTCLLAPARKDRSMCSTTTDGTIKRTVRNVTGDPIGFDGVYQIAVAVSWAAIALGKSINTDVLPALVSCVWREKEPVVVACKTTRADS